MKTEAVGIGSIPIKVAIKRMQNPTREEVKRMYGDIGVDIFDGKEKITILSDRDTKKAKSISERILKWIQSDRKFDFEENDSVKDLVLKYACNNRSSDIYAEIEQKLGQEGRKEAEIFKIIGFFRTGQ